MPIEIPKVFQPRKFRVTIDKAQVNRAGQVLPDIRVLWRAEWAAAAMPGDQATLDFRTLGRAASVQVGARRVAGLRPEVRLDRIHEIRRL